jgi:Zn finger protein HypA/HybF involved in hydrogenase expression
MMNENPIEDESINSNIIKREEVAVVTICEQSWHEVVKLKHNETCPVCGSIAYHLTIPINKIKERGVK